jgi:hypothetical protein
MKTTALHASSAPLILILAACSGASQSQQPMAAAPEPRTRAVLVGPLCQDDECRCRRGADDAGRPEGKDKRYEVRFGPSPHPLWATIDGMVLYKSRERADACFYVDLAPGPHQVVLRGDGEGAGLSAAWSIAEQGGAEGSTWWYSTFDFACGAPGQCAVDALRAWKQRALEFKGKHDPCGSTWIKGLEWETGRMPDRQHPDEIQVRLTLDVRPFTPETPPGSGECDGDPGSPAASPAEPAPDPDSP